MNNPLVSISCITYNHILYIRRCLEGFLMQQCNFEYEILIHDDASTDKTADIIREYEAKFPDIIKPIYQTENQYSKGVGISATFNWPRARGKYIALCEGDDYWTDPLKLQKQVDFLEENEVCSLVFHACKRIRKKEIKIIRFDGKSILDLNEYLLRDPFPATASLLLKKTIINHYESWMHSLFAGDFVLRYLSFFEGYIGYIDEVMCVYNKGVEGSWSRRKLTKDVVLKEYRDNLKMLNFMTINIRGAKSGEMHKKKLLRSRAYLNIALAMPTLKGFFYVMSHYKIIGYRGVAHYLLRR